MELQQYIILLPSVSHIMKAERILINENIPIKIIPIPKQFSSDCGVCIRIDENLVEKTELILSHYFESLDIRKL